jgi:NAD(P)H-flavin reductase
MKESRQSPYAPRTARITGAENEDYEIRTFKLAITDGAGMRFTPGQFMQVSIPGVGEMPVSPSSMPSAGGEFDITVRKVGNVSTALFGMKKGDVVGIRGPYGNGYPLAKFKGRDIVIAAGGVGVAPLASLADCLAGSRSDYGRIVFLYGARSPRDLIFAQKTGSWKKSGIEVRMTVDTGDETWNGNVGVVTTLFDRHDIRGGVGVACGPPVMMKFVTQSFRKIGIRDGSIYISLERMMQCGIGKCGHCNIGEKYVCTDGPVFTAKELGGLLESTWR